jgi:hypothetical protein
MGVAATAKVITSARRNGRPLVVQPGNKEWVTSIESINASGWALPAMIIFEGKVHQSVWYDDNVLPTGWTIATRSGYFGSRRCSINIRKIAQLDAIGC